MKLEKWSFGRAIQVRARPRMSAGRMRARNWPGRDSRVSPPVGECSRCLEIQPARLPPVRPSTGRGARVSAGAFSAAWVFHLPTMMDRDAIFVASR